MAAGSGEPKSANGTDETNSLVNGTASASSFKAKITGLPSSYCLEVSAFPLKLQTSGK